MSQLTFFLGALSYVWAIQLSARVRVQIHTHTHTLKIHSQVTTHLKTKAVRFVFVARGKEGALLRQLLGLNSRD